MFKHYRGARTYNNLEVQALKRLGTTALEEAALIFSKAVAASAKPASCQNTTIISKVQNVHKSQAAVEHLPKMKFCKERLQRSHEKTAAVKSYETIFFMERNESQNNLIAMLLSQATLSRLFVKYTTPPYFPGQQ